MQLCRSTPKAETNSHPKPRSTPKAPHPLDMHHAALARVLPGLYAFCDYAAEYNAEQFDGTRERPEKTQKELVQ